MCKAWPYFDNSCIYTAANFFYYLANVILFQNLLYLNCGINSLNTAIIEIFYLNWKGNANVAVLPLDELSLSIFVEGGESFMKCVDALALKYLSDWNSFIQQIIKVFLSNQMWIKAMHNRLELNILKNRSNLCIHETVSQYRWFSMRKYFCQWLYM